MTLSASDREALLSRWIQPSSNTEKLQQDRAWRMVCDAIDAYGAFKGVSKRIYAKGSYPNNTNVRQDSDVDIVVELRECHYYDYFPGVTPSAVSPIPDYEGEWTPSLWRSEVTGALVDAFGTESIDSSGKIAINVSAVESSRPSIDVVPSFLYYRIDDSAGLNKEQGSCVFPKSGAKVVNWPDQQLTNGKAKNVNSGQRYKKYVRALKRAENTLVDEGSIKALPSYLMECLVFNVPNPTLQIGNLDQGFRETLRWMYHRLDDGAAREEWAEPNELKWLFKGAQKWTPADAKELVLQTWNYLDYE